MAKKKGYPAFKKIMKPVKIGTAPKIKVGIKTRIPGLKRAK